MGYGGGISPGLLLATQVAATYAYASFIVKVPRHVPLGFPTLSRKDLGWVVPAAVLYAVQHMSRHLVAMSSSMTVLVVSRQLVPLVTLSFERFFFGTRPSVALQFCLIVSVIGVALYTHGLSKMEKTTGFFHRNSIYVLLVHLLCCAGANIWTKLAITATRPDAWSLLVNFWSIPVYGFMALLEHSRGQAPVETSLAAPPLAKAAALISVPLAVVISISASRLTHQVSPTGFAFLNGLLKLAVIAMSVAMGSLPPAGPAQWTGLVLAMAGGMLYSFVAKAQGSAPEPRTAAVAKAKAKEN